MELHRTIEKPSKYRLFVKWETLEDQPVHFRGSENFQEWRRLVRQAHTLRHAPVVSFRRMGGIAFTRAARVPLDADKLF